MASRHGPSKYHGVDRHSRWRVAAPAISVSGHANRIVPGVSRRNLAGGPCAGDRRAGAGKSGRTVGRKNRGRRPRDRERDRGCIDPEGRHYRYCIRVDRRAACVLVRLADDDAGDGAAGRVDRAGLGGVGLAVCGAATLLIAENVVQPALIGGAARLPFLLVLVGIIGGMQSFGLLGLFLGPVIMAALLTIWR